MEEGEPYPFRVCPKGRSSTLHVNGIGSLTVDESARLFELGLLYDHKDGYSLASLSRTKFTDYTHITTTPLRTWRGQMEASNTYKLNVLPAKQLGKKQGDAALKTWQAQHPR